MNRKTTSLYMIEAGEQKEHKVLVTGYHFKIDGIDFSVHRPPIAQGIKDGIPQYVLCDSSWQITNIQCGGRCFHPTAHAATISTTIERAKEAYSRALARHGRQFIINAFAEKEAQLDKLEIVVDLTHTQ